MRINEATELDFPTLTLCVVAKNEEKALPVLFCSLVSQSYPSKLIQVLLIDSMSQDTTRQIMEEFADKHVQYYRDVLVLENVGERLANGWNVALAHADSELIMRMDAHAEIPDDYIASCVLHIIGGESIVGGKVLNLPGADTDEAILANMAEDSMFGGSIAAFRHADVPRYVDTLAFAVYRTSIFDEVGLFDERLVRTEDNEMHWRMRRAGYHFYYDPSIVSLRRTRATLGALTKQKFLNGYWVGATLGVCPKCFSLYHFIPAAFVLMIALATVIVLRGVNWPAIGLWMSYAVADVSMTIASMMSSKRRCRLWILLPFVFLALHIAYGVGTLLGIVKAPSLRKSASRSQVGESN